MVEFHRLKAFKALVLGDFLLDSYTTGKVQRISPEAPVPVMQVRKQEERPGGAGNVVLNLEALGAEVIAIGRVGSDAAGKRLSKLLPNSLLVEKGYQTPVKNRLIADGQQLLRIDFETVAEVSSDLEEKVILELEKKIPTVQVVAVSDYAKGFLTKKILSAAIAIARKHSTPILIDPKGLDFSKYKGSTLIKPNLSEALGAARTHDLNESALRLNAYADALLITRSEEGISVFEKGTRADYPVRCKEVIDVTGAGDTVLAVLCLGLSNGLSYGECAQLANVAAGIAIERVGCAQVTLSELASRLLEDGGKVFDDTVALGQALQNKRYSLLMLEKDQKVSIALLKALRKIAHEEPVLYIEGEEQDEMVRTLAHFPEVRAVLFNQLTLKALCKKASPKKIYRLKNDRLYNELGRRRDRSHLDKRPPTVLQ